MWMLKILFLPSFTSNISKKFLKWLGPFKAIKLKTNQNKLGCDRVKLHFWLTILEMVNDRLVNGDGGWPSWEGWLTIIGIIFDRPADDRLGEGGWESWDYRWPSRWWWRAILGMVGEHPGNGGWQFWGKLVTILEMVGDHLWEAGWP